jgi:hypothetical protein
MPEPLVVQFHKPRLIALATGSAIMVGAGVITVMAGGLLLVTAGLAGVLFFGFAACWFLAHAFIPDPALVIDSLGLNDNSTAVSAGRIEWDEVALVGLSGSVLYVVPRTESVVARQTALKRLYMRFNAAFLGAPVIIPTLQLAVPKERIASHIDAIADARGN